MSKLPPMTALMATLKAVEDDALALNIIADARAYAAAVREATIEECAKVCEEAWHHNECAAAIRALNNDR